MSSHSWQYRLSERTDSGWDSQCWNYTGRLNRKGYGVLSRDGNETGAHRLAYEAHWGPIPCGMHVLHRCDNPACVNPNHLFVGTNADNVRDRSAKGRNGRLSGVRNPSAKLSEADVLEIRRLRGEGMIQRKIAESFGITQAMVSLIVLGKNWRTIPPEEVPR